MTRVARFAAVSIVGVLVVACATSTSSGPSSSGDAAKGASALNRAAPASPNGDGLRRASDATAVFVRVPALSDPARTAGSVVRLGTGGRVLDTWPDGVVSGDGRTLVIAEAAGQDTTVRAIGATDGSVLLARSLGGTWILPRIGRDGLPAGVSDAGATVVLAAADAATAAVSHFAILSDGLRRETAVDLRGQFSFDALSPNGGTMFLVEHQGGANYAVRSWTPDVGLHDGVVVDKSNVDEQMAGYPIAQAPAGQGLVFTMYRGPETFVHALDTTNEFAVCIDLEGMPDTMDELDLNAWAITSPDDLGHTFLTNARLGVVLELDRASFSISRRARFPAAATFAGIGRAVLAPDGRSLYVLTGRSVLAVDTGNLKVRETLALGDEAQAIAVSTGGMLVAINDRGQALTASR
jgi:hypothetical protein